mgnify:CR=1 FL=1
MCQIEPECTFQCPVCMSVNNVILDRTEGAQQSFVIDCEVCCSPVKIDVMLGLEPEDSRLVAVPAA